MSRQSFENYAERARKLENPTQASGRFLFLEAASRRIIGDVIAKLDLQPEDRLLDIGCGIGQLGIPLAFFVAEYTGIDHPDIVRRFRERFTDPAIKLLGANFLDPDFGLLAKYDKILVYDVLNYLGKDEVRPFVTKAAALLAPLGRMLLGDVPGRELKYRTLSTPRGQVVDRDWTRRKNESAPQEIEGYRAAGADSVNRDSDLTEFDDKLTLGLLADFRAAGYNAWVLPQDKRLPMWSQREDILVELP